MFTKCIFIEKCVLMKTPGLGKKDGLSNGNFKNTEILKKHGIFEKNDV